MKEFINPLPRYICFLGASGIGKSTLINALVGGGISVVPAGGIGPLTAQAILVEYGAKSSLRAEYHSKDAIYRLLVDLAKAYEMSCQPKQKSKVDALKKNISKGVPFQTDRSAIDSNKEQKILS